MRGRLPFSWFTEIDRHANDSDADSPPAWNAAITDREADMAAIARAISRTIFSTSGDDVLRQDLLFCGAGLLVSLLLLTYGLDLSPGFF